VLGIKSRPLFMLSTLYHRATPSACLLDHSSNIYWPLNTYQALL
jgi:hypothetical protein